MPLLRRQNPNGKRNNVIKSGVRHTIFAQKLGDRAGILVLKRRDGAGDGIRTHDFLLGKQTFYR